jgi:hypothetical protein
MRLRATISDRLAVFSLRSLSVLALPLIVLGASPASAQQSAAPATTAQSTAAAPAETAVISDAARQAKRDQLEARLDGIVRMFLSDPRYSRGKTPQQIRDSAEFVTGNTLFVLGHEVGHALIHQFELPVLGREEDAADSLASIIALKMANSFADRVVTNAAKGWFLSDQRDRAEGVSNDYYDEHGLDVQRAYNIVCIIVGGQPEKFAALADEVKLPKERQKACRDDYNNASWSWLQVLKPHMRKAGDPKIDIAVAYGPPGDYAAIAEHGRQLLILESVAEWLSEDFAWKNPIALEMQVCGDPGARWEWKSRRIIVCYELIREFIQLYRDYGQKPLVPGTMMVSKNKHIVANKQARASKRADKKRAAKAYRAER